MIKMNEMKPERKKLSARAKELRRRIRNEHCGYSVQSTVTVYSVCLSVCSDAMQSVVVDAALKLMALMHALMMMICPVPI